VEYETEAAEVQKRLAELQLEILPTNEEAVMDEGTCLAQLWPQWACIAPPIAGADGEMQISAWHNRNQSAPQRSADIRTNSTPNGSTAWPGASELAVKVLPLFEASAVATMSSKAYSPTAQELRLWEWCMGERARKAYERKQEQQNEKRKDGMDSAGDSKVATNAGGKRGKVEGPYLSLAPGHGDGCDGSSEAGSGSSGSASCYVRTSQDVRALWCRLAEHGFVPPPKGFVPSAKGHGSGETMRLLGIDVEWEPDSSSSLVSTSGPLSSFSSSQSRKLRHKRQQQRKAMRERGAAELRERGRQQQQQQQHQQHQQQQQEEDDDDDEEEDEEDAQDSKALANRVGASDDKSEMDMAWGPMDTKLRAELARVQERPCSTLQIAASVLAPPSATVAAAAAFGVVTAEDKVLTGASSVLVCAVIDLHLLAKPESSVESASEDLLSPPSEPLSPPPPLALLDQLLLLLFQRGYIESESPKGGGGGNVLKVGFGLQQDLRRLALSYPTMRCFDKLCGFVDLRDQQLHEPVASTVGTASAGAISHLHSLSLSALCEHELGLPLDKAEQCSHWSQRPLRSSQLRYALLDALTLVLVLPRLCVRSEHQPQSSSAGSQNGHFGETVDDGAGYRSLRARFSLLLTATLHAMPPETRAQLLHATASAEGVGRHAALRGGTMHAVLGVDHVLSHARRLGLEHKLALSPEMAVPVSSSVSHTKTIALLLFAAESDERTDGPTALVACVLPMGRRLELPKMKLAAAAAGYSCQNARLATLPELIPLFGHARGTIG
jgi:hypothetical protein